MANPQPDQYTKLSNELLEVIPQFKFNGTQLRILLVIIRCTYGFNRKEWELGLGFIAKATQICKEQIQRELTKLINANVVKVVTYCDKSIPRKLALNKDYEDWLIERGYLKSLPLANSLTVSEKGNREVANSLTGEVAKKVTGEVANSLTKKESIKEIYKENIKKDIYVSENDKSKKPKPKKSLEEIPIEFEQFWTFYPRKVEKAGALKNWKTRVKEKVNPQDLINAAKNYSIKCHVDKTEEKYIKHPKTFLGPDKPYESYISLYQQTHPNVIPELPTPSRKIDRAPEDFVDE